MSDLGALARLNDEEWADRSFTIELRGGRDDGRRFPWHDLPTLWRQPDPEPLPISMMDMDPSWPTEMRIADYQRTDSVQDDGAHIYEFYQYE